jgi:FdhD protein
MNVRFEPGIALRAAIKIGKHGASSDDEVAIEEPLEIRVAGDTVAVTMRTPGHDVELALGFLFAEGIILSIEDVGSVAHCGRPGDPAFGNVIDVSPGPGVALAPERVRSATRGTLTTAACGVCGRRSIRDLVERCPPVTSDVQVAAAELLAMQETMRGAQRNFARTGGLHAAAIFASSGELGVLSEDIGRHNAADKVVGSRLLARSLPARESILFVSGRASFEIVQKAVVAGIPIVASVSAASSLAIDLARETGMSLASFVRRDSLTVYSGAQRIRS